METSSPAPSAPVLSTETALAINSSNPTIVATWNLQQPTHAETDSIRMRLSAPERSLGPQGDRRVRVEKAHFMPGGKYRAVCKLFMKYINKPTVTYIGTGWLITDNIIATAGHCVYDGNEDGSVLQSIDIYFGYNGQESVKESTCIHRYGTVSAAPAEYLKAPSWNHDVGFVQLNSPITDITPISYVDTPLKATIDLGVVGFPAERDYGWYMYEHWTKVTIDLAQTASLLNYNIDTTGGQSGSPVFQAANTAIGVHVAGGWPNTASVIGRVGNSFEEYKLALKVKGGVTSNLVTIVNPTTTHSTIPGFMMFSVHPSAST